jgi:hypothetical protein
MGNSCWKNTSDQVIECIQQIQDVEKTLERIIQKYESQIIQEKNAMRNKLHRKNDCKRHIRSIHIIRQHKERMEKQLINCMNKRYQLESLNVTKMHLKAVKTTTQTYKQFLNEHDIEKIESLQETLSEMIEDACEINETLSTNLPNIDINDAEIEEEYNAICADIQLPTPPSEYPCFSSQKDENSKDATLELIPLKN